MSASRQEGGSPGWNEFPELDSESGAPPSQQIVYWPSSPWQHQMAFDFESYRDGSSVYIPTNICSTRSSADGDGEGLALSPLLKFSDVSYPSVPHPNAPNRFSTYPLSNSVIPLTISISRVTWKDLRAIQRSPRIIWYFYDEKEQHLMSPGRRTVEMISKLMEPLLQKSDTITSEEDFDMCGIQEVVEHLKTVVLKSVPKFKVIIHVAKQKKRVEDFDKREVLVAFKLLGKVPDFLVVTELKRDKSKRRSGKTAKSATLKILGDLEEVCDRNRNEAAKSLGDSLSYGIPQWPPGKRNENERSLSESELKGKNLSVGVPKVAFNQTSLISNPLYDMVGPLTLPTNLSSCGQQNSLRMSSARQWLSQWRRLREGLIAQDTAPQCWVEFCAEIRE